MDLYFTFLLLNINQSINQPRINKIVNFASPLSAISDLLGCWYYCRLLAYSKD